MVDCCECGNEPPSSIKCGECSLFPFLVRLRTYQHPCIILETERITNPPKQTDYLPQNLKKNLLPVAITLRSLFSEMLRCADW